MAQQDPQKAGRTSLLGLGSQGLWPNLYDVALFVLIAAAFVAMAHGAHQFAAPATRLALEPITLDPANLPEYALRTTLRMFAAILASLLFTFVVATLAAKSRKAELVIIPMLDILQSVPVLGFLTFTVTLFMGLFPTSELGVECAAIFAIFTAQAWNMAFSFYQSLRTLPTDLDEVTRQFGFSPWRRFIRLELPYAIPGLVWNVMMSMSGGWFFVVASEAITVGDKTVMLPGVGSYLAIAIQQQDLHAVGYVIVAMVAVILIYDQFLFRPLVAWADKFRMENTASQAGAPESWVLKLIQRTRMIQRILRPITRTIGRIGNRRFSLPRSKRTVVQSSPATSRLIDWVWGGLIGAMTLYALYHIARYVGTEVTLDEVGHVLVLGLITLARVVVLILVASLIWVD